MASRHRGIVRKRTTWLFFVFALIYMSVSARLVYVQVFRGEYFKQRAAEIRFREYPIDAPRGTICDRTGRVMAVNIETASVFARPKEITNPPETAVRVAALLGEEAQTVESKLNGGRGFVWLGRQVDAEVGDKLGKMRKELPGIGSERDTKRVYPVGPLAAQIVGFTNIDNVGAEGIESALDKELVGKDGLFRAELDGARRVIPETRRLVRQPENGKDVYLTIDVTIQHIAEQALAKMAETYKPTSASAIVMDPKTGEILALANYPTYDPNKARSVKPGMWRNRAVADLYEPGSTLKCVTIAAGLNEGFNPHIPVVYCKGREKMAGGSIPCVLHRPFLSGHGAADMYRIIQYSCNIGAAHVALRLGPDKLREYEKAFGLLDKTDAGFGCEAVCPKIPEDEWRPIRVANVGFGQGLAVTPLQMACVYSTIANGGVRMRPSIVREIRRSDGTICSPFKPRVAGRAVSRSTADEMTKMMTKCVQEGTGKPAQIEGRSVAGKTGSAQVVRTNGRGYESGAYVASFMGFVPANRPRLTIVVVVNRPKKSHWGATVAAPVFKEIGEKALWYLKAPSDAPTRQEIKQKRDVDKKRLA